MKERILAAMSGGVDSSIAAYMMKKAGYEVIGVTMRLICDNAGCTAENNVSDAREVAEKIGIEYRTVDFFDDFERKVIRPFVEEYKLGLTPNPCIECNRNIKFEALFKTAEEFGCKYIATGHYARKITKNGISFVAKAKDPQKDQSYVLSFLENDVLNKILFPLGEYSKAEIREIAKDLGLSVAEKKESQDICFIPDGKYSKFIDSYLGKEDESGFFVDEKGNIIGKHKGFCRYTIGQRKHLGIPLDPPLTVSRKNPADHSITLSPEENLYKDTFTAEKICGYVNNYPEKQFRCKVKIRYKAPEAEATVFKEENGNITVKFDAPQRAITPGQAAVFYLDDAVIGAGKIKNC